MKRSSGLKSKQLVARHRAQRRGKQLAERMGEWARYVKRDPCAMCHEFPPTPEERRDFGPELGTRQAHHILPQHQLKKLAQRLGFDLEFVLTDSRNGMCLCEFHHTRHTNWRLRVPRRLLPDAVYDFAAELHIEWLLDQEYPPDDHA